MSRTEFPKSVRFSAIKRCKGFCEGCNAVLRAAQFDFDHDLPAEFGGEATLENCKVLCKTCHRTKTSKTDIPAIAKSNRVRNRHLGIRKSSRPMPGSRASGWKRKLNGTVERRSAND